MFNKSFLIAILISFSIHLFWIFSINVVVPGKTMIEKVYTQIEFLGSILGKTAFDIMLERSDPYGISYQEKASLGQDEFLETNNEKRNIFIGGAETFYEKYFDSVIYSSLLAKKVLPDIFLKQNELRRNEYYSYDIHEGRKVIYKPVHPLLNRGKYGGNDVFNIKLKVLISPAGNVKMLEPINTTGYPEVDMIAMKYFKGWIFEPLIDSYDYDGWMEIEVLIETEKV